MATAHTYFVAHRDACLGERASDAALCELLARIWRERAAGTHPTPVDGVSAWLDDAGQPQLRLIRAAAVEALTDSALLGDVAARLGAPG